MKKYIKASSDLWYIDRDGREQHTFLDIEDPNSVYNVLQEVVDPDFASAFVEQYDEYIRDIKNNVATDKENISEAFTDIDSEIEDIGSETTDLRLAFNNLAEALGDEDDRINELLSVVEKHMDDLEECISNASGMVYDWRDSLGIAY